MKWSREGNRAEYRGKLARDSRGQTEMTKEN